MARLKLFWVDVDAGEPAGISRANFERLFDVSELGRFELVLGSHESADAVCLNFDYPTMSGLKLIAEAKKRWPSSPVLLLTQQNSVELALWALRSKVFDLLLKPAEADEVERVFRRVSDAAQARRSQTERKPAAFAAQLPPETRYHPHSRAILKLHAAIAHVAKHFLRPIPESEVALLCEMSPSRFCREFKAAYQVTFVEYLANYRMERAKTLLANPTMPVADVAAAVGFNDPSYFTRVFRRQEGLSPSEYRATAIVEPAQVPAVSGAG